MTIEQIHPVAPDMGAFDERDESVVRYLGLNPNSPADRAMVAVCRAYDFDPVLKHVVVIPRGGVYITRDGLLHVAHRSGQLDGIVVEQDPTLVNGEWVAKVSVYRKDMRHPFTFPGRYSANGSNKDYAQEMALKAAEAHALRRAFDVSGLPTLDEQRPEPQTSGGLSTVVQTSGEGVAPEPGHSVEPSNPSPESAPWVQDVELPEGSPLLNTRGALARRMFAAMGAINITDKADRLAFAAEVIGRQISSSAELTDAEAEAITREAEDRADQPFPSEGGE